MIKVLEFLRAPPPKECRLFAVTGEESWLREQATSRILESLPPDVEVQTVHAAASGGDAALDLRDLLDDLRTASLFGGERLVHVRNADAFVKEHQAALIRFLDGGGAVQRLVIETPELLARGAKSVPKTGVLAALEKAGGLVIACDPLYDSPFGGKGPPHLSPLSRWVQDRAAGLAKRISIEDAYVLHRLVGTGLRELDGELRKLAVFVKDRKTITAEDIEACCGGGRLAPVFDLAEAVAGRRLAEVLEQSALLFERGLMDFSGRLVREPSAVALTCLSAVALRLRKVARVRELMDAGTDFEEAARKVKQPPLFLDRLRVQVAAWRGADDVRRIVATLVELERGLKTGGPARVLFDRFAVEGLAPGGTGSAAWRA